MKLSDTPPPPFGKKKTTPPILPTLPFLWEKSELKQIELNRATLEVAPLNNLLCPAVLKLDVKDSFGYIKEIERTGKTFPTIFKLIYRHCLAFILLI